MLKRGMKATQLEAVVEILRRRQPLPEKYRDHELSGDYAGFRAFLSLFPARAGVSLRLDVALAESRTLPRTRGGEPCFFPWLDIGCWYTAWKRNGLCLRSSGLERIAISFRCQALLQTCSSAAVPFSLA